MIWRIVRKDWRQLWALVTIVAMAQGVNAALWFSLGQFNEPRGLVIVANVFSIAMWLGMAALIAAVVHEDRLPGVSQDWLIRPIPRGDLLCAKLVFVAMAVHGPMLLADVAHGIAAGFPVRDSLGAALSRTVSVLLAFDLPVLALAAITSTLVQVAAGMLSICLMVMGGVAIGVLIRGGAPPAFAASGIQWMTPTFWSMLAVLATAVTVPLQYFRRATTRARRVVGVAVLLAPMLSLSTWASAFSVQRWLSPNPALAEPIAIAFDPGLGRSAGEPDPTSASAVRLPLRVSGLARESMVVNDRADVRLVGIDGTTLFRGRTTANVGYGDDFPVRTADGGEVRTHQQITFPGSVYEHVRSQLLRVEIDYSLTLFLVEANNTIAAMNGDERLAAFGWCRTKIDADGDDIELGCVKAGAAPTCVSMTLENPVNGRRNPDNWNCHPDYAPYRTHPYPDAIAQLGGGLPFRDVQGLTKYPVNASQLPAAQVNLKSYRPQAHFTRRLVIPEVRLGEWAASPAGGGIRQH
jgi:hypothetical protein